MIVPTWTSVKNMPNFHNSLKFARLCRHAIYADLQFTPTCNLCRLAIYADLIFPSLNFSRLFKFIFVVLSTYNLVNTKNIYNSITKKTLVNTI